MAKSDFERTAEQLRSQIDALRGNIDDLQRNYTRWINHPSQFFESAGEPVSSAARKAEKAMKNAAEDITSSGIPWWAPVAAIGFIAAGVWIYNMLSPRTEHQVAHEAHRVMHEMNNQMNPVTGTQPGNREQFPPFHAGQQPPFGATTPPRTPGQP